MTENTSTHLIVIVDRSGSMSSIRNDMIGGLETFLDAQRAIPGELTVDWVQFDNVAEFVHRGANVADVTVTLEPRAEPRCLTRSAWRSTTSLLVTTRWRSRRGRRTFRSLS